MPQGGRRNGPLISGENRSIRQGGMRSWGSPAVTPSGVDAESPAESSKPEKKSLGKRKRDEEEEAAPSSKVVNRMRKKAAKLKAGGKGFSLDDLLDKLQQGKKGDNDREAVAEACHCSNGRWTLDLGDMKCIILTYSLIEVKSNETGSGNGSGFAGIFLSILNFTRQRFRCLLCLYSESKSRLSL